MVCKTFLSNEKIQEKSNDVRITVSVLPITQSSINLLFKMELFKLTLWLSTSFPAVDLPCENPSLLVINRVQKGNRARVGKLKKSRQKHF